MEAVGPNTPGWEVGDHVIFTFLPACGRCRWCAEGRSNLCNSSLYTVHGSRFDDPDALEKSDAREHLLEFIELAEAPEWRASQTATPAVVES